MEYKKYLINIKVQLLEITDCNKAIIAECRKNRILGLCDLSELIARDNNPVEKNNKFWEYIEARPKIWETLIKIFENDGQAGVVELLQKGERDDGKETMYNFIANLKPLEVVVVKKKFGETVTHGDDGYMIDPDNIGLALVINISKFDDPKNDRKGSEQDVMYMKSLWTKMGYSVYTHQGPYYTAADVEKIVDNFLNIFRKKMTPESCVVFIGTHGENGNLLMSDGKTIRLYEDIIFKFKDERVFKFPKAKPVLFFIQACRYFPDERGGGVTTVETLKELEHMLVSFSTVEGEGANRHTKLGSFFVYTLTEVFMREAYRMELTKMLDEVRRNMINKIQSSESNTQVSSYRSFNLSPLYFNLMADLGDESQS